MPASWFQVSGVQRWPRVGLMFQVRRAKPRAQRVALSPLKGKLSLGGRARVLWRRLVNTRETMVRIDTPKS